MAPRFKSSEPGKEGLSPEREDFPGFLLFEKSYVSIIVRDGAGQCRNDACTLCGVHRIRRNRPSGIRTGIKDG